MRPLNMIGAWDPLSAWLYDEVVARDLGPLYDRFVAEAAADRPEYRTIVDVGCGTGEVARRLGERHPEAAVIGVDLSPFMVRRAARRQAGASNVSFRVGDAASLPLADASADLVVSVASIKHWPDRLAGLREIVRILRPGGWLSAVEVDRDCSVSSAERFARLWRPRLPGAPLLSAAYFRRFVAAQSLSLEEMVELMARCGVRDLEATRVESLPFVAVRARAPSEE